MERFDISFDGDALPFQFFSTDRFGVSRIIPEMNLRRVGEDRLLKQLLPSLPTGKNVIIGAGDDCALTEVPQKGRLLILKTDCGVEKVHFGRKANPVLTGWKAMMRPLSDFAAVSGVPQFALVTLI